MDVTGSGLMGVKNDIVSSLKRRYADIEKNVNLAVATILDPRFKAVPFKDKEALEEAKTRILTEMRDAESPGSSNTSVEQEEPSHSLDESKQLSFWSHYAQAFANVNPISSTVQRTLENELQLYLEEGLIQLQGEEKSIFEYWDISSSFRLKQVAMKYLCIPPATVFSERLFSTAGLVCDKKRNRLDPERVKMLVFLNKNLR